MWKAKLQSDVTYQGKLIIIFVILFPTIPRGMKSRAIFKTAAFAPQQISINKRRNCKSAHIPSKSAQNCLSEVLSTEVPRGLTFTCWDVTVYVNQPSLPTPLYSVLVSISVFMFLSTVFHFINSPDNSPFPDSVLPACLRLIVPFNYRPLYKSLL